jgi:hypothetical protein
MEHRPQLIEGIEWTPCLIGAVFNLRRAYRDDQQGHSPDRFTYREQFLYCVYGIYQLGTFLSVMKGLESALR